MAGGARVPELKARSMRLAAIAALCLPMLAGCQEGLLVPVGPVALSEKTILIDATVIMLAVIVPVILLTLYFAWWFRAKNTHAKYRPDWAYSGTIEIVVWAIPAMVILFLGGMAWIGSHDLDPPKPIASTKPAVEVEVVSLDWKWLFIYPNEHIASLNKLVLPVGTPVHFRLTSTSVMNSFMIPRLGGQIYTMNGMVTQINLRADQAGTYKGLSAQFSGDGFSDMRFDTLVVSDQDYAQWLSATRAGQTPLDNPTYDALAAPSEREPVRAYSDVAPGLFERIVATHQPAAAAPGHNK